jgi:hypothetical protein
MACEWSEEVTWADFFSNDPLYLHAHPHAWNRSYWWVIHDQELYEEGDGDYSLTNTHERPLTVSCVSRISAWWAFVGSLLLMKQAFKSSKKSSAGWTKQGESDSWSMHTSKCNHYCDHLQGFAKKKKRPSNDEVVCEQTQSKGSLVIRLKCCLGKMWQIFLLLV